MLWTWATTKKGEYFQLEAKIDASAAKLTVLQTSDRKSVSNVQSNAMNSCLKTEAGRTATSNILNPKGKGLQTCLEKNIAECHQITHYQLFCCPRKLVNKLQLDCSGAKQWTDAEITITELPWQITIVWTITAFATLHIQCSANWWKATWRHLHHSAVTKTLIQQPCLLSLQVRDIPIFKGDPLQYKPFIRAFEQGLKERASRGNCLYYLEKRGQPRESVHSCQHMVPEHCCAQAKNVLLEHFSNEYGIATVCMEKALVWLSIKHEDVESL